MLAGSFCLMSNGTNILEVTIDTTKELALIGMKLDLGKKYFEGLNNHLYNADGVFLSLSTNPKYFKITVQILDEVIENDMGYDLAPFKRTKPRLSKSELSNISIEELSKVKDTGFRSRAANSPPFYHLGDKCVISLKCIGMSQQDTGRRQLIWFQAITKPVSVLSVILKDQKILTN